MSELVRRTSKRKKKNKRNRNRNTGRCQTVLRRKDKRRLRLEMNKYIVIDGVKILKPQWRD